MKKCIFLNFSTSFYFQTITLPMIKLTNSIYRGAEQRQSLVDLHVPEQFNGELLLFIHGFMGFKDWGAWPLMQDYFVNLGYGFCKFNMTHNGGTVENPIDFPDETAFSRNTYSKEVFDLGCVLDFLEEKLENWPSVTVIGHSRGGGIALLKASDTRIKRIVTLAGISSIALRFSDPEVIASWKENGVRYVSNQRTKQQLPMSYEQVEDFLLHEEALSVEQSCLNLKKPVLHLHGDQDVSVPLWEGENMAQKTKSKLQVIAGADHVFGSSHPWKEPTLPVLLKEACDLIHEFINLQTHS